MFSLFLGTHSKLVGLGGIDRAVQVLAAALLRVKETRQLRCTCGADARECPFWGAVAAQVSPRLLNSRHARYELALQTFTDVFGEDRWPIDSSKHVEPLRDFQSMTNLDVRVVHVIKDVRSFTISFIEQARRKKNITRPGTLLAIEYFWRWRRENQKIENFLKRYHIRAKRVGYEEACLAPEKVMAAVSAFLGVGHEDGSIAFDNSASHLIVGNRMRGQAEKRQLRYDHRWFARRDWAWAAVLFPQILHYNSHLVYSNQTDAMWAR
jgi:hypothetical protein